MKTHPAPTRFRTEPLEPRRLLSISSPTIETYGTPPDSSGAEVGAAVTVPVSAARQAAIVLDSSVTYQAMGQPAGPGGPRAGIWEATAWAGKTSQPAFDNYIDELLDLAVEELGIDRVRLEVRSGAENAQDYWSAWQAAGAPDPPDPAYYDWRLHRYATVDDDGDPFNIDWNGFHFSELDNTIQKVILPLQQKLAAIGRQLYVNVNYVSFNGQVTDPALDYHHTRDPQEYAEFVLATYLHMQSAYGFVPDSWEVVLEPENTSTGNPGGNTWPRWTANYIAQSIVAAGTRLQAHGFATRFVAPANVNAGNTASWASTIAQYPGALNHFGEISYHLYGGNNLSNRQNIAAVGAQYGLNTAQLEYMHADYHDLHNDLKHGNNSTWASFTFRDHITVDDGDPANPIVALSDSAKPMRQYMKFVDAGAVRIDAGSDHGDFDPVAFINQDGGYVVVVKAAAGGSFSLAGLAEGTYGVKYTTPAEFDVDLPDVTVQAGGVVNAAIPRNGVITVYSIAAPGVLQFDTSTYNVNETAGTATVTVSRTGGSIGAVSVDYATANGTATAGSDYTATSGTLTWADGDASDKTLTVPILDDPLIEGNETVNLALSNPTGGATLGGRAAAVLTITDDDVDLNVGLAGHWALDDGGGVTATDSSGNGNHGTLSGGPVWTTGKLDGGLRFDGQNDHVAVSDAPALNPSSELTLSAWVNSTNVAAGGIVVSKGGGAGVEQQYYLRVFPNSVRFRLTTSQSIASYEPSYPFSNNTWYHLAATYDGVTMRLFVDGTEIGAAFPQAGTIVGTNGTGVTIGKRSGSTINHFAGVIDDVRVYDRQLSAGEVDALYRFGPGTLQWSAAGFSVGEAQGSATITVARTGGGTGAVAVDYATSDGTATAAEDYLAAAGTLTWADGDVADKSFTITILDDALIEGDETVNVALSNPTGGVALGLPATAALTIADDDFDLNMGLEGHWALDDGGGIAAADSSGNANHGTLTGGPLWTTGKLAGALGFDGQNDHVAVGDAPALNPSSELTLSAWVNSTNVAAGGIVISKGGATGVPQQYYLRVFPNRVRFRLVTSQSIASYEPSYAFSNDTWYHLAATYDGVTMRIFVDGSEIGTPYQQSGAIAGTNGTGVTIGKRSGSTINHFAGVIDDVRLYDRQLSAVEVDALYRYHPATVTGRHVFYNNSTFDGDDPAANVQDDNAIAPDKAALAPGGTAAFANYTSYSRGINGLMIDVAHLAAVPTAADFALKVGNDDDPSGWADAPAPSTITVRPGDGSGGSDRITLVWPDGAIAKQWLQVTVMATARTGLLEPNVFYFGNAVGECGNSATDAKVTVADMLSARDNQRGFLNPAPIDFHFDYDRNARVNAVDMLISRNNQTHFLNALKLITAPPAAAKEAVAREVTASQVSPGRLDWLYELTPAKGNHRPSGWEIRLAPPLST